jgi:anti-sigma B factor antagonist
MRIWQTRQDEAVILHLSGPLGVGEGAQALRDAVDRVLTGDGRGLVLDLSGVGYLDAAGMGELVLCHQKALYRGWRVVLSGCCRHVSEVLGVTHLAGRIDQVPSEEQALHRLRVLTGRWEARSQPQAAGHLV